jgi:hypothetical protein
MTGKVLWADTIVVKENWDMADSPVVAANPHRPGMFAVGTVLANPNAPTGSSTAMAGFGHMYSGFVSGAKLTGSVQLVTADDVSIVSAITSNVGTQSYGRPKVNPPAAVFAVTSSGPEAGSKVLGQPSCSPGNTGLSYLGDTDVLVFAVDDSASCKWAQILGGAGRDMATGIGATMVLEYYSDRLTPDNAVDVVITVAGTIASNPAQFGATTVYPTGFHSKSAFVATMLGTTGRMIQVFTPLGGDFSPVSVSAGAPGMVLLSGHFSKPIVVGQPNDASGQGIATSLHVEHGYDALVLAVPVYDIADTWWDVASDRNACMPMPQYRVLQPVSYGPALVIKTAILSNDGGWNHFTVLAQNNPESEGDESFDGCVLFDLAVVNPRTGAEIYSFTDGVTPDVCELFSFSFFLVVCHSLSPLSPRRLTNFYLFKKNTHIFNFSYSTSRALRTALRANATIRIRKARSSSEQCRGTRWQIRPMLHGGFREPGAPSLGSSSPMLSRPAWPCLLRSPRRRARGPAESRTRRAWVPESPSGSQSPRWSRGSVWFSCGAKRVLKPPALPSTQLLGIK